MVNKKRWWFLCVLLLLEGVGRLVEDPYDINFLFDWNFLETRARVSWIAAHLPENPRIPLTREGYRGVWTKKSKGEGEVRIVFVGAGHGFADNIDFGMAWSELLEASLAKKQKNNVEVWNFSVNGSTVVFAERCLLGELISYEPDVVIFSHSGYNEAIRSDIEDSYVVHDGLHVMNVLFSSALFRQGVLIGGGLWNSMMGKERRPKVPVDEFVIRYDHMIHKLKEKGIPILLLQQEVVTPDIPPFWFVSNTKPYRKAFQHLAQKHGLVYLQPQEWMHGAQSIYFDQGEYYSPMMHAVIAREIEPYITLLVSP